MGCGKEKANRAAPACELYTGPLFRASRRWAEQNTDAYFIASAKHLVIEPNTVIEPYDLAMSDLPADEQRWRAKQIESQFHLHWKEYCEFGRNSRGFQVAVDKPRVVLLASQLYLRGFYDRILAGRDKYSFEDPLRGLGIGNRLAWFKAQTRSSVNSQLDLF
ncbi:DUF6884 domain-containing protein [Rhodopirellula sallentina]